MTFTVKTHVSLVRHPCTAGHSRGGWYGQQFCGVTHQVDQLVQLVTNSQNEQPPLMPEFRMLWRMVLHMVYRRVSRFQSHASNDVVMLYAQVP